MPGIDLSLEKAAQIFGYDTRTVQRWIRDGLPASKDSRNRWTINSASASNWLRERERDSALGEVARVDENEAKRRKLVAEAGREELKLALEQGAAIPIALYEASMAAMIGAARAKLLGMPAKLGPLVTTCGGATEAREIIHAETVDILLELREFDGSDSLREFGGTSESTADESEAGEPVGATSDADDC